MKGRKRFNLSNFFVLFLMFLHLGLLASVEYTAWPEMMLWPYLILKGWLPYKDIAIAHNPILLIDLDVWYKLFGLSVFTLKAYTWVYIILTDILLYIISGKVFNKKTALVALIFYIPLQVYFQGNGIWFDLMLAPLALVLFYLIYFKRYFISGLVWVLMFLTKQTAVWFLLPIIWVFKNNNFKNITKWILGGMFLIMVFIFAVFVLGIQKDYFYWAVKFGIWELPKLEGQVKYPILLDLVKSLLPFSSLLILLTNNKKQFYMLFSWVIAGFLGVYPRFEFFHFQPSLPFLAIAWGLVMTKLGSLSNIKRVVLFSFLFMSVVLVSRGILRNVGKEERFLEKDVLAVSDYIRKNTDNKDLIYVYNAWDNIYVLSDRMPANKPWIPFLSWYLSYDNQEEKLLNGLMINPPKLIVAGDYGKDESQIKSSAMIKTFLDNNYEVSKSFGIYSVLVKNK